MPIDTRRVQGALAFAAECHGRANQMRATATPYIVHPYAVMGLVQRHAEDYGTNLENALCLAALHDTVEDTDIGIIDIREKFGEQVAAGVQALSKNGVIEDKMDRLIDSLERCAQLGSWCVGVKGADRIENLSFVTIPDGWSRQKRIDYVHKEAPVILYYCRKAGMMQTADRLELAMHVYEQYIPPT